MSNTKYAHSVNTAEYASFPAFVLKTTVLCRDEVYQEVLSELDRLEEDFHSNKQVYQRLLMQAKRNENRNAESEKKAYLQLRNKIFQDRELSDDPKLCEKTVWYINDKIKDQ